MDPIHDKILADPRFRELVSRRNRFSFTLAVIVLAVYAGFVSVAVFNPALFASSFAGQSAWAWGLIAGFCIQGWAAKRRSGSGLAAAAASGCRRWTDSFQICVTAFR